MRRIFINFFCFILFIKISLYSDLLESNFNFHSTSLHLFSNPSLLVKQQGVPLSAIFSIPSNKEKFEGKGSISFLIDKSALSFGYEKKESDKNRVITGYSFEKGIFNFGSSISLFVEPHSEPDLIIDAAATVKLHQDRYISLILNNIIGTDTIQREQIPKGSVSFFGAFPRIEKYLGFDITYYSNIFDFKEAIIGHGVKTMIIGSISEAPLFHYSGGYEVYQDKRKKTDQNIQGCIGLQLKINEFTTGLSYGLQYDVKRSECKMNFTINCNPTIYQKKTIPSIDIKVMKGSESNPGVYVSMNCSDTRKSSDVKKWVLIFSTLPSKEGKIIKSFSGGNIPPSTVFWDQRDYKGNFIDQECLYIRAVVLDYRNNVATTAWILFDPKNN